MFPTVSACLAELREWGVNSIEINELNPSTDPDLIEHAAEAILSSGLQITVHGWLPMGSSQEELIRLLAVVERSLRRSGHGEAIACTVHGHHASDPPDKMQATEWTIRDLASLVSMLADQDSLWVPALEVCRHKAGGPVGVTYGEVLDMADQVSQAELGVCWDVGHSQVNYVRFGHEPFPDQAFISRLIHTHIHDILPNGKTHGPLVKIDGYVRECLAMMQAGGYEGVYNLELYPIRWEGTPQERKDALRVSIGNLRTMLEG
jgi:sugar phosphate isomerase/epimerase